MEGPLTPLTRTYLQLQVTINCQVACSSSKGSFKNRIFSLSGLFWENLHAAFDSCAADRRVDIWLESLVYSFKATAEEAPSL